MAEKLQYDADVGDLILGANTIAEAIFLDMEGEAVDAAMCEIARRYNSAPALLEALKLYHDACGLLSDGPDDSDAAQALAQILEARTKAAQAIAQAEGASDGCR
jgi:hypothetical protein